MYKLGQKVVITNNKNHYYRRRGTVSKGQYHLDGFPYYVVFTDGDWDYYAESELKPFVKKISKPIKQSFTPTSSRLEKVTVGDTEFYPSSQHTVTVQLKITAETKELAKAKVRRYLDRQMLEGSVE